jgi:hypothetical protein
MSILPTIHTKAGTVTNTLKIQANLNLRKMKINPFNREKSLKLGFLFIDYCLAHFIFWQLRVFVTLVA